MLAPNMWHRFLGTFSSLFLSFVAFSFLDYILLCLSQYDSPAQIAPSSEKSIIPPAKKPLPGISVKGQRVTSPSADYISYTVSVPSGRATTLFSADGLYKYLDLFPRYRAKLIFIILNFLC